MQNDPSDPSAAQHPAKRQPCWRLWRVLFLLLATPLTLLALFYAEEDWRARREWNRFELEQASAESKTFSEVSGAVPARVPDDQNFFATPYWKFAPAYIRTLMGRDTWIPSPVQKKGGSHDTILALAGPDAGSTNVYAQALAKSRSLWFVFDAGRNGDWRVGCSMKLTRWADVLSAMDARSHEPNVLFLTGRELRKYGPWKPVWPTNSAPAEGFSGTNEASAGAVVLKAISPFEPVLAELLAASGRPYSRFDFDFLSLREAERMARLRCGAEVALGEAEAARRDLDLGLRMTTANSSSPMILSAVFTGIGLDWCLQSLWEGMIRHEWTEPQLQDFQDHLTQIDLLGQFDACLGTAEKAQTQTTDLRRAGNPKLFWNQEIDSANHSTEHDEMSSVLRLLPSGWVSFELINYKREWQRMRHSCFDVGRQSIFPGAVAAETQRLEALDEESKALRSGDFTRFGNDYLGLATLCFDPAAFRPLWKHHVVVVNNRDIGSIGAWLRKFPATAYAQTGVNLGLVACVLERHRIARGEYPETLQALEPRFAEKLPHDILTGKPLLYHRREPQSYLLYSVGWNEKDDGGQVTKHKVAYSEIGVAHIEIERNDQKNGDWVWAVPASE